MCRNYIFLATLFALALRVSVVQAQEVKPIIYILPGQGSDYRVFKNLSIDSAYQTINIDYITPNEGTTMNNFARQLAKQIDTCQAFILIGVSLGGMLATEMSDFLDPEKTIIISSAKCRNELPRRYKFQRRFPIYKFVSGKASKKGAQILQPIVEPDRNNEKEVCKAMLNDKDPAFLKNTITMIMEWDRSSYRDGIVHIHGNNDHTIPIRNVSCDYIIDKGSHMMVLTRANEISILINKILNGE